MEISWNFVSPEMWEPCDVNMPMKYDIIALREVAPQDWDVAPPVSIAAYETLFLDFSWETMVGASVLGALQFTPSNPSRTQVAISKMDYIPRNDSHLLCVKMLFGDYETEELKDSGAPLTYAITNDNDKCVDLLIRAGASINDTDVRGRTPLTSAAFYGSTKCLEKLIKAGANINDPDARGRTPLSSAAFRGSRKCLEKLIKAGANINHAVEKSRAPCSSAVFNWSRQCRGKFVKPGSNDVYDMCSLSSASSDDSTACLNLKLVKADVGGLRKSEPALVECVSNSQTRWDQLSQNEPNHHQPKNCKQIESMETLIKAGANVDIQNSSGIIALMKASENGYEDCVKLLLEAGADVNVTCKKGHTALIYSAMHGREACLNALITAGVDVTSKETQGSTAFIFASAHGHCNCVKHLILAGVDVNFKDSEGFTALTQATHFASFKCIDTLLQSGADVNQITKDQGTVLLMASMYNEMRRQLDIVLTGDVFVPENHSVLKSVETLINAGADVNTKDNTGNVPLINVVLHDHVQCVPLLLAAGADVNATDNQSGSSALMIAIKKDKNETFYQLLKAGADVNIVNNAGDTALTIAAVTENFSVVKGLLKENCRINKLRGMPHNALMSHVNHDLSNSGIITALFAVGEELVHPSWGAYPIPEDVAMPLKHICKEVIRKHLLKLDLNSNLFGRIPLLGLPGALNRYLLDDVSLDEFDCS